MKKIILLLSIIILNSCSRDDNGTGPINNDLRVKKITESNSVTNFLYSNNLLSETIKTTPGELDFHKEYFYTNGKITQTKAYRINPNNVLSDLEIHNYSYTGNNITSSTLDQDGVVYNNTYTYVNDKLTNRKEFFFNGNLNTNYNYEYYPDGRLKKEDANGFVTNFNTYDSKINYSQLYLTNELQKLYLVSVNNLTGSSNTNGAYTYEYLYNSNNLPTKVESFLNGVLISTKVIQYE